MNEKPTAEAASGLNDGLGGGKKLKGDAMSEEIDFDIVENLQAENAALRLKLKCYRALVGAVESTECDGIRCNLVMGINWFDARDQMNRSA